MGKLATQPEPAIQHFSHLHPLQLFNYQPQQTLCVATCSACKLNVSGWIYICTNCSYFLHISCSGLPQQITHPYDQDHILSLLSTPSYPEGLFNCDACGKQGSGFSYHCKTCNVDLHTSCASMPLSFTHQLHHHQLNLTFSIPYLNKSFCCDICHDLGFNQWLYRCNLCEFDAHLGCATTKPKPAPAQLLIQQVQASTIQQGQVQYNQRSTTPAFVQYQVAEIPSVTRLPMQSLVPINATASAFRSNLPMTAARSDQLGNLLSNQRLMQALLGMGGGGSGGGGFDLGSILGGGGGGIDLGSILGGSGVGIDLGGLGGIDTGGLGGLDFGGF